MFRFDHGDTAVLPASIAIAGKSTSFEQFQIKHLGGQHLAEMQRILLNVDEQSRLNRLCPLVSGEPLIEYPSYSLEKWSCGLGAFIGEHIRGVAVVHDIEGSDVAVSTIIVEPEWRRRRLAWALLQGALQAAAAKKRKSLRLVIPRDDWPMRRLAHKPKRDLISYLATSWLTSVQ